jgi:aminoglycoside 6'-N-acetyltransferase
VTETRIEGERLVLESVRPEHVERLRELRREPDVARWWNTGPEGWPLDEEEDDTNLAVVADGEVVGYVQFWEDPDPSGRHADVDIFLGTAAQGGGMGTEVMRMVTRHLIEERGHHRITLSTSVDNDRAIHVYEKLGFRRVGVMRKSSLRDVSGEWEDEWLMELVV